jgi:hypothetical protein
MQFSKLCRGAAARSMHHTAHIGGWRQMSFFGASRFTAILAVIAVFGTAGSFWWAIQTRGVLKSGAASRSANHASPSKPLGHASRSKDERSNKFVSFVKNERPQPSAPPWGEDRGQASERPTASRVYVNYANADVGSRGADMPLPIPPVRSDLESWQAKIPEPAVFVPPLPVENPRRQTREPKSEPAAGAASSSTKPARSYYLEKFVEQGDAGEVKFRYRRQPCEPPNMPDVCFMPQSSRRNIVVERR